MLKKCNYQYEQYYFLYFAKFIYTLQIIYSIYRIEKNASVTSLLLLMNYWMLYEAKRNMTRNEWILLNYNSVNYKFN